MFSCKNSFMKDVTQLLNGYRECVRNLWNIHFINRTSLTSAWDLFEEYDDICSKLLAALVLDHVDRHTYTKARAYALSPEPLLFFRVVPTPKTGVPINISREKNNSGYWDYPITLVKPGDADMRFIDLFDFDLLGFRDFQYCRVRIVGSKANPDLVGHDALLGCNHVRILFDAKILMPDTGKRKGKRVK